MVGDNIENRYVKECIKTCCMEFSDVKNYCGRSRSFRVVLIICNIICFSSADLLFNWQTEYQQVLYMKPWEKPKD